MLTFGRDAATTCASIARRQRRIQATLPVTIRVSSVADHEVHSVRRFMPSRSYGYDHRSRCGRRSVTDTTQCPLFEYVAGCYTFVNSREGLGDISGSRGNQAETSPTHLPATMMAASTDSTPVLLPIVLRRTSIINSTSITLHITTSKHAREYAAANDSLETSTAIPQPHLIELAAAMKFGGTSAGHLRGRHDPSALRAYD